MYGLTGIFFQDVSKCRDFRQFELAALVLVQEVVYSWFVTFCRFIGSWSKKTFHELFASVYLAYKICRRSKNPSKIFMIFTTFFSTFLGTLLKFSPTFFKYFPNLPQIFLINSRNLSAICRRSSKNNWKVLKNFFPVHFHTLHNFFETWSKFFFNYLKILPELSQNFLKTGNRLFPILFRQDKFYLHSLQILPRIYPLTYLNYSNIFKISHFQQVVDKFYVKLTEIMRRFLWVLKELLKTRDDEI